MQNCSICQSNMARGKKNSMNKLKCDYYLLYLIDFETDICVHKFMHQTKTFFPLFFVAFEGRGHMNKKSQQRNE